MVSVSCYWKGYVIFHNMKWILWGKILKTGLAISYYYKPWLDLDGPVYAHDFNVLHWGSEKNYSILVAMDICLQNSFILIHHFMMNWDWMEKTNIGIRTHCSLPSAPEAGWTNSFIPGKRDRNPKFAGLIPQSRPEQFPH